MPLCAICKLNAGTIIGDNKSECYCDVCWYHENAPILLLAKLWDYEPLYNPKTNRFIEPAANHLESCGFKLFRERVFFNRKGNQKYRSTYLYKYSGALRCQALREYKAWPTRMPICDKVGCSFY